MGVIVTVFVSLIAILCVLGNLLVIVAVRTQFCLRNLSDLFIASLAAADFLMGLVVIPLSVTEYTLGYWAVGAGICGLYTSSVVALCAISIFHLCAIALDRYFTLRLGVPYLQSRTNRKMMYWIGLMWITGITIGVIPLMFHWKIYTNIKGVYQCETPRHEAGFNTYISVILVSSMSLMIVLYTQLFLKLRRILASKRNVGVTDPTTVSIEMTGDSSSMEMTGGGREPAREQKDKILLSKERKAARVLGLVTGGFLICWTPFLISTLAALYPGYTPPKVAFWISGFLGFINSALNPFIYTFYSPDFRKGFKNLLRMPWCY